MSVIKSTFISMLMTMSVAAVFSQNVITLQPGPDDGKDAQLWSYQPDMNLCEAPYCAAMGWTFSGGNPGMHRGLVEFDLWQIPEGTAITEANLYFYYYSHPPNYLPHTGANQAHLKLITQPWKVEEVCWNNPPATTFENMVYVPASTSPDQDYIIDVTGLIQLQHEYPELYHGMMLQLENENPYNCLMFGSSDNPDSTLWPKLVVEYCYLPSCAFEYEATGLEVTFTDISSPANSWYWDFGDGYFSDLQNPSHEYDSPGEYIVSLTVTDDCGTSTATHTLHLDVMGISSLSIPGIHVYPNPANSLVSIRFRAGGNFSISLVSSLGEIVMMEETRVDNGEVRDHDVNSLAPGLYFLKVDGLESGFCKKLIIQH